jgi:hypothetical protein
MKIASGYFTRGAQRSLQYVVAAVYKQIFNYILLKKKYSSTLPDLELPQLSPLKNHLFRLTFPKVTQAILLKMNSMSVVEPTIHDRDAFIATYNNIC